MNKRIFTQNILHYLIKAVKQQEDMLPDFTQGLATGDHICIIIRQAAYCRGRNMYGQLGNSTTTTLDSTSFVPVSGMSSHVTAIEVGNKHTCAIHNGAVKCWGDNSYGQLGDGTTTTRREPVTVTGLTTGVTALSTGAFHNCAIQNGSAKCWGRDIARFKESVRFKGVLGIGDRRNPEDFVLTATQVVGLTRGVEQISAGNYQSCAIQNGSLKCWGYFDREFILGPPNYGSLTPIEIAGFSTNVKFVSVTKIGNTSNNYKCVVMIDNTVKCFRKDGGGPISTPSFDGDDTPMSISGLGSSITDISAGYDYACVIQNGAAKCWGRNNDGQLGDGTTTDSLTTAVQVNGLISGVKIISMGGRLENCAATHNNIYCWNSNGLKEIQ